jgi:hypothetical protein
MRAEQLAMGEAIRLVNERFAGQAELIAQTPFGQAQQSRNLIEDQSAQLGQSFVSIGNDILPEVVALLKEFNADLESPAGQEFISMLGEGLALLVRWSVVIAAITAGYKGWSFLESLFKGIVTGLKGMAAAQLEVVAAQTALTAAQERYLALRTQGVTDMRLWDAELKAMTASQESLAAAQAARTAALGTTLMSIAGGVGGAAIGERAGGSQGAVLGGVIGASVTSNPTAGLIVGMALLGNEVARLIDFGIGWFAGANYDFLTLSGEMKLFRDIYQQITASPTDSKGRPTGAGLSLPEPPLSDEEMYRLHFAKPPRDYFDPKQGVMVHDPGNLAEVRAPMPQNDLNAAWDASDKSQLASHTQQMLGDEAKLQQELKELRDSYENADRAERSKKDDEDNRRRLDAQLETLQQYLARKQELEQAPIQKRIDELAPADAMLRKQIDLYTSNGDVSLRIQVEQKLLEIEKELLPLQQQLSDLKRTETEQALTLADAEAKRAQSALGRSAAQIKEGIETGQISPAQGHADLQGALAQYSNNISNVRAALTDIINQQPEFAAAARAALQEINAEAVATEEKLRQVGSDVRSAAQASAQASKSLEDEFRNGLGSALDDLTKKGQTAADALRKFFTGLLDLITKTGANRVAEGFTGALSGGQEGGGVFQLLGAGATGNAGGVPKAADASGQAIGSIVSMATQSIGSFLGFAAGGYTGGGGSRDVAGVVHRNEYVLNESQVRGLGGPSAVEAMLSRSIRRPAAYSYSPSSSSAAGLSGAGGGGLGDVVDRFHKAINDFSEAQAQPRVHVAVPVTGDLAQQIIDHPDSPQVLHDMIARNQQTFAPLFNAMTQAGG